MGKRQVKRERLNLLQRQTELEINNCKKCDKKVKNYSNSNCIGCKVFKEMNEIGAELLNPSVANSGKKKSSCKPRPKPSLPGEGVLTIKEFVELRKEGLMQKEIAEHLKISDAHVSQWKKRNIEQIKAYAKGIGMSEEEIDCNLKRKSALTLRRFAEMRLSGLSQEQIAERLGITNSAISHWKKVNKKEIESYESENGIKFDDIKIERRTKMSNTSIECFIDLKRKCLTGQQIAKELGVSESTLYYWKRRNAKKIEEYEKNNPIEVKGKPLENGMREKVEEKSLEDTAYELGTKSIDNINPGHYKIGGIETFDYIQAKLSSRELDGYLKGNIIKYVSRERFKNRTEDLKKAQWYLDKLVEIRAED